MSRYRLGHDAEQDLDDIWEFVAAHNIDAADRLVAKFFDTFEALAQMPGMGHQRKDLTHLAVLFWPVGNYLVIYRAERTPIEIVAVVHGKRDVPTFLRQRVFE
ncbi:MAG TPA: type II toxin-antitoxin system RelE/ParE family toxin [Terriglobia bacterium]|nr:type II toxin-antitoxin system RelE/ParE family toxin [Terriglobia bacterium]